MDLRQLEYFVTCAEQKNFSAAAEVLFTSQPHISMVIHSLEQELGCKLFERTSRGVVLTDDGVRNYEYANNMLKNAYLMESGSSQQGKGLCTLYTNSSSNMAVLFSKFFLKHQEYHYRYIEAGVETILEKVSQHEAEIGFVFVPSNKKRAFNYILERKHLRFTPLMQSDMVVYVGKNNPLYGRKSLKPQELQNLRFVQMADDFFSFQELLGETNSFKKKEGPENVVETNSSHVMVQLLNNSNLCNLCSYWLKDRYKYYDFGMIPVESYENMITFGFISTHEDDLSPLCAEFLRYVEVVISQENDDV